MFGVILWRVFGGFVSSLFWGFGIYVYEFINIYTSIF